MKDWFKKLRDINTTIAFATLIITSIGVFAGAQLLSDNVFKSDDCEADAIGQNSSKGAVKNTIVCSGGSSITNVTQE
ncbi:MAG: hypothetical protein AAFQ80_02850 [Cyanobacteria bacterium J06621_8]